MAVNYYPNCFCCGGSSSKSSGSTSNQSTSGSTSNQSTSGSTSGSTSKQSTSGSSSGSTSGSTGSTSGSSSGSTSTSGSSGSKSSGSSGSSGSKSSASGSSASGSSASTASTSPVCCGLDGVVTPFLHITFGACTGNMSDLSGVTVALSYLNSNIWQSPTYHGATTVYNISVSCNTVTHIWQSIVQISSGVQTGCQASCGPSSITCSPLSIVFSAYGYTCGGYTIAQGVLTA